MMEQLFHRIIKLNYVNKILLLLDTLPFKYQTLKHKYGDGYFINPYKLLWKDITVGA
jgi:hypothetical protein